MVWPCTTVRVYQINFQRTQGGITISIVSQQMLTRTTITDMFLTFEDKFTWNFVFIFNSLSEKVSRFSNSHNLCQLNKEVYQSHTHTHTHFFFKGIFSC